MAVRKPVKVLTDLLTKKEIIKRDENDNIVFNVSGALGAGHVSSSLPISASDGYFANSLTVDGILSAEEVHVTTLVNSLNYETSISASINALLDVSASNAQAGQFLKWDGSQWVGDIVSNATSASYATTAAYAQSTTLDSAGIVSAYNRLRFQEVGYFDVDGNKTVILPTASLGAAAFPTGSIDYVNVTVFIKDSGRWTNDLIAAESYVSGNNIVVDLYAPALTDTDQYKLLAINENPSDYVIL